MPLKEVADIVVGGRVKRIDCDGFPKCVLGLFKFLSGKKKHAVVVITFNRAWFEAGCRTIVLLCLLELTQPPVELDQIDVRLSQLRVDFKGPLMCRHGLFQPSLPLELDAAQRYDSTPVNGSHTAVLTVTDAQLVECMRFAASRMKLLIELAETLQAPVVDLGYDAYYWGSQYWADFVIADWVTANRSNPNRPTVLTFYGGNTAPPEEMPNERIKLLTTPFSNYFNSLRSDLNRVLAGRNFDFDRDVTAVYLYRWGHSMVYPKPGWPFSAPINKNGQAIRVPSPRFYARQQVGRISFGAQDVESSPANESAIGAGLRTSGEVLPLL